MKRLYIKCEIYALLVKMLKDLAIWRIVQGSEFCIE